MDGAALTDARRSLTADDAAPKRTVVATVPSYEEAANAVAYLEDARFPVERTTIAARDLTLVVHVAGRRTLARAAVEAGVIGGIVGGLAGLLASFVSPGADAVAASALGGMIIGSLVGLAIGWFGHARGGPETSLASRSAVHADHYDVLVDDPLADEATLLLTDWALQRSSQRLRRTASV